MPATEHANGSLQKGFGKRTLCSLLVALFITTLVVASYVLSGGTTDLFHGLSSPLSLAYNQSGTERRNEFVKFNKPCSANLTSNTPCLRIDSEDSGIQLTHRRIPDVTELKHYEPHLFSVIPHRFLRFSHSSCWYQRYDGNDSTNPYGHNGYSLYAKRLLSIFKEMQQGFWQRLQVIDGERYRLRCLPNFFIIGQPKCGTTDLYDRLRLHPNVQFSVIKEPHWWTRKRFGIIRLKEPFQKPYLLEDYLDLFDSAAQKVQDYHKASEPKDGKIDPILVGEASASTMWDNSAWSYFYDNITNTEPPVLVQDFIHAFQPQAKFIVMLRDPVERLYSDYLYFVIANKSAEDFHDKVNESLQMFDSCLQVSSLRACVYNTTFSNTVPVRLQVGLYVVYLWDWLSVYNLDQFLILRLEDHAANITQSMRLVYRFLSLGLLNNEQEASVTNKQASNSRRPADCSLGPMLPQTRQILRDFYRPYNQKLAQMLSNSAFLWKT